MSCSIIDCKPRCCVTNTMLTQYSLSLPVTKLGDYRFTMLQLLSDFLLFLSSVTTFYHKLLTWECRVLANGWTRPPFMTIFVNLFIRSVIRKVTIVTLNIILTIVATTWNSNLHMYEVTSNLYWWWWRWQQQPHYWQPTNVTQLFLILYIALDGFRIYCDGRF